MSYTLSFSLLPIHIEMQNLCIYMYILTQIFLHTSTHVHAHVDFHCKLGKTLIAREIAKLLNARTPKVVNGPEILDKYIGEAERNIRELFRDADEEWDRLGYRSDLHVIVLDEFDSIAKRRGVLAGDGSGECM